MMNLTRIFLLATLLSAHVGFCAPLNGQTYPASESQKAETYQSVISAKLGSGFSNLVLSPLEIPKNIINTTNETNLALGVTGGVAKGLLHMAGRFMAGVVDTLTFPIPSQPLTTPPYPWQDFKIETRYNPLFKMKQ